jgi:hypothetical protein
MENEMKKHEKIRQTIIGAIRRRGKYVLPGDPSVDLLDCIEILCDHGVVAFKEHEDDVLVAGIVDHRFTGRK